MDSHYQIKFIYFTLEVKFKVISLSFRISIVVHVNFFLEDTDICYPKIKEMYGLTGIIFCDWTSRLDIWAVVRYLADPCLVILDVMTTEKHPEIFQSD